VQIANVLGKKSATGQAKERHVMKSRAGVFVWAILMASLAARPASAQFDALSVGAKAGTLGVGGEVTTDLLPQLNVRGSFQWLDLGLDLSIEGIDYNADVGLSNPMVLVDWYPFAGVFRLTGGVLFNGSDVALSSTPTGPVEIGGTTYLPSQVGTLRGEADFDEFAPYVGIGWGNTLSEDGHWSLSLDLGVAFIGSPNVKLSATGPYATNPTFQQNLAEEQKDIEDYLSKFRFYPVLSLALCYRF
jgi:hypothetical protein